MTVEPTTKYQKQEINEVDFWCLIGQPIQQYKIPYTNNFEYFKQLKCSGKPSRMPLSPSQGWPEWGGGEVCNLECRVTWASSSPGRHKPSTARLTVRTLDCGIEQVSHFPEYKQNACWKAFNPYARLGARKLLEADEKENNRVFPALHRLEKAEFSWPRDRKVLRSRSTEERILT